MTGQGLIGDSALARIVRSLRRSPAFAAVATLSVASAIGLSTAVFGFIDSMTHPRSGIGDVDRAFQLYLWRSARVGMDRDAFAGQIATLPGIARVATATQGWAYTEAGSSADQLLVASVQPGFFDFLAARPRLGRFPQDNDPRALTEAVVSDAAWRKYYGNRSAIRGETIRIDSVTYTIVGVMPFRGEAPFGTDAWVLAPGVDLAVNAMYFARIRPDATPLAVQAQLDDLLARIVRRNPAQAAPHAALKSLRPDPLKLADYHRAMLGAAICLLLVACANVAALMLARGTIRKRDYALRLALGARRRDLALEVIAEVAVLAVAGAIGGTAVAAWATPLIAQAIPPEMSWLGLVAPQWSWRVLALVGASLIVSVAVAGGFPAWRAARTDPAHPLKESSGGTTARAATRFRWLVVGELAVTMMLLMIGTLMVKSAMTMAEEDPSGERGDGYIAYMFFRSRATDDWSAHRDEIGTIVARARAIPGVRGAVATTDCPVDHFTLTTDWTNQGGATTNYYPSCTNVGPGWFAMSGERIIDGRDFTVADRAGAGAYILDSVTAAALFPGERAVGHMMKMGDLASPLPWRPIVGVASSPRMTLYAQHSLYAGRRVTVYGAMPVEGTRLFLQVSAAKGSPGVAVALSRIARDAIKDRGVARVASSSEDYLQRFSAQRFLAWLFGLLAAGSLALGAAGLFSVVSYVASQRMREFAIRIALGATGGRLTRLVVRDGMIMGLGGTAIGAFLGMKAGFLIWDRMYGDLYPVDVGPLLVAEVLLLAVTAAASMVPALRASRADPLEVMRAI